MGYRVIQLYFETPNGYFSVYLLQHAYTKDDEIVCRYKSEIITVDSGREGYCAYMGGWKEHIIEALIEGIENAYDRGAMKLLFTKCLEDSDQVAKMFHEG